MTSERIEGPTPNGDWALVVWMDLERWVEVPLEKATGCVISEYRGGLMVFETIARLDEVPSERSTS